jgi:hypothetical protein
MPAQALVLLPEGAGTTIAIVISGHISPKCTVDSGRATEANFGNVLDTKTGRALPATIDMPFGMDCNTPYTATLSSRNGGLLFDGNPAPQFASQIIYSAMLGLGQIAGAPSLSCDSQKMHAIGGDSRSSACHADSTGWVGRSNGEGHVRLQIIPSDAPLLQGTYSDQLTLRISPTISG